MTYDDIVSYLEASLKGFENDPADSDYQRGYKAALEEVLKVAQEIEAIDVKS